MFNLLPLDILNQRKLSRIPKHFSKIKISENNFFADVDSISSWIKNRCKGRYSICQIPTADSDGKIKSQVFAGFEEEKELTYFMLGCPHFRR